MFGQTNPFGQTNNASSPFGSPSVFGQTNSASNNPFAAKPFGSTTPFGSQPGTSLFGGTSTGVFGQPSTPMNSTTTFGASSSLAFGSSTPAFGASSTPSFGSSMFGQKPAFGSFGSTPTQPSPFGNSFQQSQPAFGSSMFGSSTHFGASSQPAFGATSSPAFGASSTPAFGATSSPAFGSTAGPAFGASNTSVFGSGGAFGASSTPTFGTSSASAFGASSTPAFGASSAPAFGASSTPAFGASSSPSFNFGSTPAFGHSTSAFGSSPFGNSTTPFGAQSSPFGAQATTPAFGNTGFGQSAFGGQSGGSRVAAYTPTTEADGGNAQSAGKLESISAMPVYKDKSHEELRWEDYQLGDKGGPRPGGQSAGGIGFNTSAPQSNPFNPTPSFAQTSSNPFSTSTSSNPFAPKTSNFSGTGFATSSPAFGSSALSNPFGTASSTPSLFQTSTPANPFGSNSTPSLFNTTSSSAFGSSPSIFGSGPAQETTSAFSGGFGNTQSTGLFQSGSSLGQAGSAFGQTTSAFGQSSAPSFNQSSIFNTPSTGFGGLFSSTPSMISSNPSGFGQMPSLSTPFQSAQPGQATGSFGCNNFGQTQAANTSGFGIGGTSSAFGQNNFGQPVATQTPAILQPMPITNPFGTLPAMPQMSIGRAGTAPSVQYGISSMPVVDKPAPIRISSLLTSRHLSQRRFRFPARKYHPKNDGPKVPFFSDDEERPSTPKADALFIPRENPRALVVRPTEQWPTRASAEKASPLKESSTTVHENGKVSEETSGPPRNGFSAEDKGGNGNLAEDGTANDRNHIVKDNHKPNGVHGDLATQKDDSRTRHSGHRAGEADIEAQLPKLRRSDYYTEPTIQELAAKERSNPGFCRRVKDFVVGRHGYGSIKFEGVTDVRRLDLESLIQFNNREVIVYMDDSKKPPVGQGLNKPAEVTLLNIKCFDKKTGKQYTEEPKVEKYTEMLKRKVEDQGATFVSYDPIKGKWRFRVKHFSKYSLVDEDECDNPSQQFGPEPAGI